MLWFRYILVRIFTIICNMIARIKYRKIKIGYKARILPKSKFEGYNKIDNFTIFGGEIGFGSYIGSNSFVIAKIGRFCSIADNVKFVSSTHPVKDFVSTHPAFYSLNKPSGISFVSKQKFCERPALTDQQYPVIVGNDVYIGFGATIIGPVRIGDGAVIAANATVTKDIAPYTIVGGIPSKVIRKRFNEDEIEFLLAYKWWNKDINWWKEHADEFENIYSFIEKNKHK